MQADRWILEEVLGRTCWVRASGRTANEILLEEAASSRGSCRIERATASLDVLDNSVLADHEGCAIGQHLLVQHVIFLGNRATLVTEDGKLEAQQLRESLVCL